jgi:hypothetical protein
MIVVRPEMQMLDIAQAEPKRRVHHLHETDHGGRPFEPAEQVGELAHPDSLWLRQHITLTRPT